MERRSERNAETTAPRSAPESGTVVDARLSLALWLRAGRAERGLSLDDVARITKIQVRILERLESGAIKPGDGLPADVFLRGFIRSFAKCCGLDEQEALRRYSACTAQLAGAAPVAARAVVDAMGDLAPRTSEVVRAAVKAPEAPEPRHVPDVIEVIEPAPSVDPVAATGNEAKADAPTDTAAASTASSKKKKRRGGKRAKRKSLATGTPSQPMPIVAAAADADADAAPATNVSSASADASAPAAPAVATAVDVSAAASVEPAAPAADVVLDPTPVIEPALDPLVAPASVDEDVIATPIWQPKMPPLATTTTVPWRGPTSAAYVARSTAPVVPTLVIDDADPEGAEQVREERVAARSQARRSFLPPILLDHEDRSTRQGGLTLAVIILLIAATLTLSYLMRRPSSSGDGVTQAPARPALVDATLVG